MTFSFHVKRPYHIPALSIETDCPNIYKLYQLWEGAYLFPGVLEDSLKASISREGNSYCLTIENDVYRTEQPMELLQELYRDRLMIEEAYFPLHGGAVACGQSSGSRSAVVFAGATGKGKTTLTAYLAMRGYSYITDDIVFIRKKDCQVFSYPKPVHLRPGGHAALAAQGLSLPDMDYANTADPRYCYTPENVQEEPLPLRAVYFTAFGEQNRMEPLSSSDALERLLKSPVHQQKLSGAYLGFLIGLVQKVVCAELWYRDFSYVEEVLQGEVDCSE